jgi:hypothetical protein
VTDIYNETRKLSLPLYMKTNLGIKERVREYPGDAKRPQAKAPDQLRYLPTVEHQE